MEKEKNESTDRDTVCLLRECNSGVKMGISSIDDVMPYVKGDALRDLLREGHRRHEELGEKAHRLLSECHDAAKEPSAVVKGMAQIKTTVKLTLHHTDAEAASLISDGCSMGIRSLAKYLNQYPAASENSRMLAKDIISLESDMEQRLRSYL